ncbi:SOS response-associated peptidase [Kribbella sp. NBC_00482]|uniref:SOS response-associated peptidase family protein n=1 Tax=Kribbella sp. NBC_00482 TaxID=2975968 RepID=UPI002E16B75B
MPTYTIITTTATDSVGRINDRMPMAITPDHLHEWLDPRNHDVDQLRGLMAPPGDGRLDMYAVSKAVNNVKNNGPERLAAGTGSTWSQTNRCRRGAAGFTSAHLCCGVLAIKAEAAQPATIRQLQLPKRGSVRPASEILKPVQQTHGSGREVAL